jgi:hypothetical protein
MKKKGTSEVRTWLTLGLVVRGALEDLERVKEFIAANPRLQLVYQTTDVGRLWISRRPEGREES